MPLLLPMTRESVRTLSSKTGSDKTDSERTNREADISKEKYLITSRRSFISES